MLLLNMKNILNIFSIILFLLFTSFNVFAHSGNTGPTGCHMDYNNAYYHCHQKKNNYSILNQYYYIHYQGNVYGPYSSRSSCSAAARGANLYGYWCSTSQY